MSFDQITFIFIYLFLIIYSIYLIVFINGFFLPRKYFSSNMPKTTIIVAVRDGESSIERCINSICRQTYSEKHFEVIIANDQSTDATENIVKSMQKKYKNLKLINIKNRPENFAPKKYAITEALKSATGEIILTTDADITVKPTWVESVISFFEKNVGLVVGFSSVREFKPGKMFQLFESLDFLMLLTATKGSIRIGLPISCTGQNLAFRRIAFDEVGGFGDKNSTQSGDDVLLLHLMRKSKKWGIAFADDPKSYVETDASKSLKSFLKQRIRWAAMGVGQFAKSINLTVISIATAVVNISLFLLAAGFWVITSELHIFIIIALILKLILDFLIALIGSIYFKKTSWIWFFPFLFIFYMPYIFFISFFSIFGNFTWKERVYVQGKVK
jgi:cellulose synthase/poly-beta-1,6-N-acetylglucosamine synthase-like glycosyltransferase